MIGAVGALLIFIVGLSLSGRFTPSAAGEPYVGPDVYSGGSSTVITTTTIAGNIVTVTTQVSQGVVIQPAQTGIVPTLVLQDSYGVNHTLASSAVPLSVAGAPTIPASRGKLFFSLKGYFEVDDSLIEKYGELQSWDVSGYVMPSISFSSGSVNREGYRDLEGAYGHTTYNRFDLISQGNGRPVASFPVYLTIRTLSAADIKNFIDISGLCCYTNTVGTHYLRFSISGTLNLHFAGSDVNKSFSGVLSVSSFEYTHDGQLLFFASSEISRVSSEPAGLSIIWAQPSKVVF